MVKGHQIYVVRETTIHTAVNLMMVTIIAYLVFADRPTIELWGAHGVIFDLVIETLVVSFLGSMIPAFLTQKRAAAGKLMRSGTPLPGLPQNLLLQSLLIAVVTVLLFVPVTTGLITLRWPTSLTFDTLITVKLILGLVVCILVTPIAILAVLRQT